MAMTTFREFFRGLEMDQRYSLAQMAGTTKSHLSNVAYSDKPVDLGLADALVAVSGQFPGGPLSLEDFQLTERAQHQRAVREQFGRPATAPGDRRHGDRRSGQDRRSADRRAQ